MSERDEFLRALTENEDDVPLRLSYADWLDESGEHEEADRQRKWPAAKEWFDKFCREHNPPPGEETDVRAISRQRLIEMGREAIKEVLASRQCNTRFYNSEQMLGMGWENLEKSRLIEDADQWEFTFSFGNHYDMCWAFADNCSDFWKHWSVLTGIPLPPGVVEKSRFRCAC